ncbi:MAG: urea ABC transporter permease subunit UrtC [Candidatus Anaerobiospirillum merdipullorum]|uniref:Urea ABC transporter permease subunit UrtC n=1 Tax=Candidatus Anaerobiospirillum merdipullorum TaxID=2838450 RepID=A0A9E2KNS6_9GAMM|nr:urea ABC transporter permease subunit UrtC [Candidatus Anaerobiospirillum merdipullorum]
MHSAKHVTAPVKPELTLEVSSPIFNRSTCYVVELLALLTIGSTIGALCGLISIYAVTLMGKYLCYALAALSLDLIWGRLGILSLGHCAYFALGGYMLGMYLTLQIGTQGVYGSNLPDFMIFLNWDHLPWYWQGSHYLLPSLVLSLLVPAALAFIFGFTTFRSRVGGVYLSIITQALTYALMLMFFLNELGFGGNNGLTDFKTLAGMDITADGTRIFLFALTAICLLLAFLLLRALNCTRLGRLLTAVRDSESRVRFIGYRTEHVKLAIFTLAAALAGLAGALYVPQVGIINPGEFSPLNSIELVICVALGGRDRLYGAIIGSLVLNLVKTIFTAWWPEGWLYVLGALFVIITLFLPHGLAGLPQQLKWHRSNTIKEAA